MRQSQLFSKTRKEALKEETSLNAQLLTRAGFIDKLMAGAYTFLPLGHRVLSKIENIIREEMQSIGSQELLLPALHPAEVWKTSGRWDSFDALIKVESRHTDRGWALGPTHEEVITPLVQRLVTSHKDLPLSVFQIQTKFRDEARPRSGLLRGREFRMKDMYSFHATQEDLDRYYEVVQRVYERVFNRLGLGAVTYLTYASGGSFSQYSHEFQTIVPAGEDTIYVCRDKNMAVNREIFDQVKEAKEFAGCEFVQEKAIEVGNIFKLGTRFSQAFGLKTTHSSGESKEVVMGCYGIGPSRVMGAIVEVHHDQNGIVWPRAVAPYQVHLLALGKDAPVTQESQKVYDRLTAAGVEVLFDDRVGYSNGAKLNECDLIGIPTRVIISGKSLSQNQAEVKARSENSSQLIDLENLQQYTLDLAKG